MIRSKEVRTAAGFTTNDYIRVFSESRANGIRRIKFWGSTIKPEAVEPALRAAYGDKLVSVVALRGSNWMWPSLVVRVVSE